MRSFTVWDTRTSDGPAFPPTRAPIDDGQPSDLAVDHLHLARVDPRSNLDPEGEDGGPDRAGAVDRTRRPVERGEEAVAGRVHLRPLVAGELPSYARVVRLDQLLPRSVAEARGFLRRGHDIGEQDRGERALELRLLDAEASDEGLDLVEHAVVVTDPEEVRVARELHEPGAGDLRGRVPHLLDREVAIAGPREDQRGTWIAGRAWDALISRFMRVSAMAAPGLAARRR